MTCPKCGCSVHDQPFIRMNPKGEDLIAWCEPCAKKYEPELYKNEKDDETELEKFLKNSTYRKKNCQACNNKRHGVKTRVAVQHTCN